MKPIGQSNNRVILVVPGVTGCSGDRYVQEMVHNAIRNGYTAVVLNHLAHKQDKSNDLRLLDFSQVHIM